MTEKFGMKPKMYKPIGKEKKVRIEEFYRKEDGIVIHYWRYGGEKDWRGETTPYEEVPYKLVNSHK